MGLDNSIENVCDWVNAIVCVFFRTWDFWMTDIKHVQITAAFFAVLFMPSSAWLKFQTELSNLAERQAQTGCMSQRAQNDRPVLLRVLLLNFANTFYTCSLYLHLSALNLYRLTSTCHSILLLYWLFFTFF